MPEGSTAAHFPRTLATEPAMRTFTPTRGFSGSPPRPKIVFCTAYDQYAIPAFDQHATDYILKPVNRGRLAQTVERVRSSLRETRQLRRELRDATSTQERLLPQSLPAMETLDYAGTCRPARLEWPRRG